MGALEVHLHLMFYVKLLSSYEVPIAPVHASPLFLLPRQKPIDYGIPPWWIEKGFVNPSVVGDEDTGKQGMVGGGEDELWRLANSDSSARISIRNWDFIVDEPVHQAFDQVS